MLKIYTAQYRYSGVDRLDITVKGNDPLGRFFAPTWGMVNAIKKDGDEGSYMLGYYTLMLDSWHDHQEKWQELLAREEVTLVCFCPPGAFCHRLLLSEYLEKLGAVHLGERNLSGGIPQPDKLMNILDVKQGIICQQVNCKGVMGAGLAKAIRQKWPVVYETYMEQHRTHQLRVGKLHIVPVNNTNLIVANLCGQDRYGRDKRYTDYIGLRKAIKKLAEFRKIHHNVTGDRLPVYFPHGMGCTTARGDWYLVYNIIKNIFPDAVIVRYS